MNLGSPARLPLNCHYKDCPSIQLGPGERRLVRKGSFYRKSDSRRIARFQCHSCRRSFSRASASPCFGQKRRNLNKPILKLLVSGVSQRRIALITGTNRKTVVRKLLFLARRASLRQAALLSSLRDSYEKIQTIQLDEMVSFEKSKCLPISIPVIVQPGTRKILGLGVCSMPAHGALAHRSRLKYGKRADERATIITGLLESLREVLAPGGVAGRGTVISDQNPHYPQWILKSLGEVRHIAHKSRRACVVGHGELKRGGFDPLFDLNHTCAMIRANVSRLIRKTWCTTKRRDRLLAHLTVYADFHNRVLT